MSKGLFGPSKPVREWLPYKDDDREPEDIEPSDAEDRPVPQDQPDDGRDEAVETFRKAAAQGDDFARHLLNILESKEEVNHGGT